jgi:hypothetical protein
MAPKFVTPDDFDGEIPGRGRRPSQLALEISKSLEGCPVGSGLLLEIDGTSASTPKDRGRIRSSISTAADHAGWGSASIKWTTTDQPFVVRVS